MEQMMHQMVLTQNEQGQRIERVEGMINAWGNLYATDMTHLFWEARLYHPRYNPRPTPPPPTFHHTTPPPQYYPASSSPGSTVPLAYSRQGTPVHYPYHGDDSVHTEVLPTPTESPHHGSSQGMRQLGFFTPDICFEVLPRLPSKALLGLKCVSKEWHRLISDRSFIQLQLKKSEPVSGFFFQERFRWCFDDIEIIRYIPVELKTAKVRKVSFDFLGEDVAVLASCNGLICCRSCFPSEDPVIYICNPVNKEWVKVGCTALKREDNIALAFDPSRDLVRDATYFKVVRVEQLETHLEMDDWRYSFNIHSSKTGLWTKSKEICQCNGGIYKNNGVFVGGVLHWLTGEGQILTFNVEEERSWLVSVPIPPKMFNSVPAVCIGECGGRLHYAMVTEEGVARVVAREVL